jgi:hypothetical protein
MTDAQQLQNLLVRASEGVKKTGFESNQVASISAQMSSTADTWTFTCVLPITTQVTADGQSIVVAKDWLTLQPLAA